MSEQTEQLDFLQSFLKQAQDDLKRPTSSGGTFGAVTFSTGFQVYGIPEPKFFEGGSTESENVSAHNAALAYATENGVKDSVSFAMRLTVLGGEQYPESKIYQSEDGNYSRTVMNFNSRHPVFDQWDSPGVAWAELVKSFSGDNPITAEMLGNGKFYAHIISVPSPYFDETVKYHPYFATNGVPEDIKNRPDYSPVDDSKLKYVVRWDKQSDSPAYGDDGNLMPEFLTRVKAAFRSREELVAYAYELGVTGEEATADGVPAPIGVWIGSDKEWAKIWPEIEKNLRGLVGKPKPVAKKSDEYKWLTGEAVLTDDEIFGDDGLLLAVVPF